jgi:serine protease Do
LKVGDILVSVHGRPIPNVRQLAFNMYSYAVGDSAEIEVLRRGQKLSFRVPVLERTTGPLAFEDLIGEADSTLPKLGILGLTVSDDILPLLPPMRLAGGVLVAAKLAGSRPRLGDDLSVGDIIHALNGAKVSDLGSLRARINSLNSESPIVVQVERSGMLHFVTLEGD